MHYTMKTSTCSENYRVCREQYRFDKFEIVEHRRTGRHWDEKNKCWISSLVHVSYGVNTLSDYNNGKLIKIEREAEQCRGYDPYNLSHW